jgi:peptidoglycan/xylan/chitin deacetylase (PgdA/CDA1 family)
LRWYSKKGARKTLALVSGIGRRIARRDERSPRVRALTYHRFGAAYHDPFCVAVEDFDRQMAWLREQQRAVSLAQLVDFIAGRCTLADGSVLVTIDDGCPSLHTDALPILRRYGIPAVAFVPAGELRDRSSNDARMSWTQLREIADAGIEIGSHSFAHASLGQMGAEQVREQLTRSREVLESRLGRRVTAFAYPFGTFADFNETTATLLRETGYTCAFTSQHGAIAPCCDALALPRVKVESGEGLWMFRLLADGALDDWRWIDRTLWRVQARGA